MKLAALAILGLVTVAACETRQGEESARAVDAADTIITSEQNIDTTIVTQDTTVEVDTIRRDNEEPASRDTLKETSPSTSATTDTVGLDTDTVGLDTLQQ
jgi:hypothetical protein